MKIAFPYSFADNEANNRDDKWHQIGLLKDGFKINCAQNFVASSP
jgi:hypothetical protein